MGTCAHHQPKVEPSHFQSRQKVQKKASGLQIPRIAGVVEDLSSYGFGVRSEELKFLVLPTQRSIQDLPFAHGAVLRPPQTTPTVTHRIPTRHLLFVWRWEVTAHVVFVSVIGSDGGPGTRGWSDERIAEV